LRFTERVYRIEIRYRRGRWGNQDRGSGDRSASIVDCSTGAHVRPVVHRGTTL